MATPTKSEFPHFVDGDILVVISTTQYYKLHSQVLSAHSTYFADQITNKPGPRLTAAARRENHPAYRFEFKRGAGDGGFGEFIRVEINEAGRAINPTTNVLLPDLDNGKVGDNINRAWDWLFEVFYNRHPIFDDTSLATVLSCVVALIECAEAVGSIEHVRGVVDLALMRQDNVLWTSILGNPAVWIELGRRVRSPQIYSEAAIHLIGQWGTISEVDKMPIGADIRAILDRKYNDLALVKEAVELRILGHYPEFMRRSAADKPGRPTYGNDIYMWMAVCFFRQWFAQQISDDRTRRAPDGGLGFYTALHLGQQNYLGHLDFQEFHKYFPMSLKACQLLEANMGVLKEDIKRFVDDLMIERTHLKREQHEINWLTCVNIEKEDWPWYVPQTKKSNDALENMFNEMGEESEVEDNDAAQAKALAAASAVAVKPKSRANEGSSVGRPRKRARVSESVEPSGSEYHPDSQSSGGSNMFVSERGNFQDDMIE